MRHPGAPSPETLELLKHEFGADLLTAPKELDARSRDDSGVRLPPAAVLLAGSTAQVARLLSLANERLFAVVPRGAGTGLAGGCLAETGGVVLDLSAMNRILSIDCDSVTATVEPGVLTGALRSAAKDKGLFYPPDPASLETSTIGGNAATNAGGPACVKYGTTRDYVLGLTAVLPTGEVVRTGTATRKGVVGYDLTRLLVGSEGTLGVITQLTLKLLPHPQTQRCLAAVFPGLEAAMGAVIAVMTRGHLPAAMEFLDARCLKLVGDLLPEHVRARLSGGGEALALMECDGSPDEAVRGVAAIEDICRELGALAILPAPDEAAREAVWAVRRSVSTRIHEACAVYVPEDIAVPIGRIAHMVAALPEVERRFGVDIFAFGHAGDGNIHLNLTSPDEAARPRVEAAAEDCVRLALALGGTMSGEHGVGLAKRAMLPLEIEPVSLRVQRGIKGLLDPKNILNPGKLFPADAEEGAMELESRLSRRVKRIKISATKEMPMIAAAVGGCVSLGQGIPSFKTPEHVVDAVARALRDDPGAGKYSLQPGMPELRRAVAELLAAEKGLRADPEREVAITVGGMEALLCAMLTLVGPGDEVIVPEPFYPSHVEQILMAEGTPVFAPLRRADWSLDPDAVEAAVTPRTKAIVISHPHNPTGAVWAERDLRRVAELAIRNKVFVICDDTYDALAYDGASAFSLASLPELRHLLVGVFSFSKRFALTGWRVGFAWAREPLLNQMLKIHDAAAICAPTPAQIAALASLTGPQDTYASMRAQLEQRRDLICSRLSAMPGMAHVRPGGAFYVMARPGLPQGAVADSRELAIRLIREARVITIPGGAFGPGGEGHVRLSFGGDEAEINEACDRLSAWSAGL